jgi:hypothetical protein
MAWHRSRNLKRTDLFLVRVWTEAKDDGAGYGSDDAKGSDQREACTAEWQGKVQRVTDGEVRRFDTLQALTGLLLEMLSGPRETL